MPNSIEDRRARRKRDAVRGAAAFAALRAACAACFAALCFLPDGPGWLDVLFGTLAVASILPLVPAAALLRERFKEIEGGELDAAAEY